MAYRITIQLDRLSEFDAEGGPAAGEVEERRGMVVDLPDTYDVRLEALCFFESTSNDLLQLAHLAAPGARPRPTSDD